MVGWGAQGRCCPSYAVSTQKAIENMFLNFPFHTHLTEQICFYFNPSVLYYSCYTETALSQRYKLHIAVHMTFFSLFPLKQNSNLFTCHYSTIKNSRTATDDTQTSFWMNHASWFQEIKLI